jgi:hypothetical protein
MQLVHRHHQLWLDHGHHPNLIKILLTPGV